MKRCLIHWDWADCFLWRYHYFMSVGSFKMEHIRSSSPLFLSLWRKSVLTFRRVFSLLFVCPELKRTFTNVLRLFRLSQRLLWPIVEKTFNVTHAWSRVKNTACCPNASSWLLNWLWSVEQHFPFCAQRETGNKKNIARKSDRDMGK